MKTIEISDQDYQALMKLSKELQTQPNHGQAFPYIWEPASEKPVQTHNGDGNLIQVYDPEDSELFLPLDYAELNEELWKSFLESYEVDPDQTPTELESEWIDFLNGESGTEVIYSNWEKSIDHNPSLFLSDVKGYIEGNKHHLGRNPHTYANTIQRMPKMEQLIEILYRLNPQPKEEVNHEAQRFVFKGVK